MRGTKILLSDDGSFSLHFCPGQDPNFLDVEGDQAEGRQIMHRYIRTGLATMGMRIYVLHEVVGADVSELLSDLGRARTPATEEWRESDFEAGTSWMNGHRLGRRDRAGHIGKRRQKPRLDAPDMVIAFDQEIIGDGVGDD
jgi:hypothetical protein